MLALGGIMGFRICLAGALICAAVLVATAANVSPVEAGGSNLSYNELTRIIMGGSAPAPGSYQNGSFDADFQAAAAPVKQGHGLFAMINMAKNAMNAFHNGFANTAYFLNNMERDDNPSQQTGTIQLPDKNQYIHLNMADKTYYITSPSTVPMQTMPPVPQSQQGGPPATMPPQQPGTAKLAITVSTASLGSKNLGGVDTQGYQVTFKMVSSQATGSCTNGTFETSITEFVSSYPEPSIRWPETMPRSAAPPPAMKNPEMASFKPGCKPTVTARVHVGPTAPSGRLVIWELLNINMGQGQNTGGFSTLIERGDVKNLSGSDAGLFGPPAGYTQQAPPANGQ
jgi:hypothetical protein